MVREKRASEVLRTATIGDLLRLDAPVLGLLGEAAVIGSSVALLISLFLPWYHLAVALEPGADASLNAWEAFSTADVLLAALAAYGLVSIAIAWSLGFRALYALVPLFSWLGVALILYAYFRPEGLVDFGDAFPGPPGVGFLVAFAAAGTMTGSSLVAVLARR